MRLIAPFMIIFGLPLGWTTRLDAPLPPESMDLVALKGERQPIDPELARWYDKVEQPIDMIKLSNDEFGKLISSYGPASQTFFRLRRLESQNRQQWTAAAGKIAGEMDKLISQRAWGTDPLLPDLLWELLRLENLPEQRQELFRNSIRSNPVRSCPQKRLVLQDIRQRPSATKPGEAGRIEDLLKSIEGFRAKRFQENALDDLLKQVKAEQRDSLRGKFLELARPYPRLLSSHSWLVEDQERELKAKRVSEPLIGFDQADEMAGKRQCNEARDRVIRAFGHDKKGQHFAEAQAILNKIENCYRRQGSRARLRYWSHMRPHLAKTYGFEGEELALRPQGLIHWGQDEFEEARKVFTYLLETARKQEHGEIESRTLYTFARVDENEGRLEDAIAKYRSFLERFPEDEKINEGLGSLVVLSSITGKEREALSYARQLIQRESLKDTADRDGASLSFALFWAGKLSLEQGHNLQAYELWRRVASEFYSTFYGALGHYMLETMLQRRFVIPPNHVANFDFAKMQQGFAEADRMIIQRIDQFLALGMQGAAACETAELDIDPDNEMQNLVLSMYLYASGEWLDAIRHFGGLSRSFRHTLPQGMERILYPRAYQDIISSYTDRLKVEEPIIYAIMRQESVFNPRARSPVGATGLMQLMPATARMEARYLERGYVNASTRQQLIERATNVSNLYDPETNITLGVHHVHRLLKRYSHPVFMLTSYNANPRATARWQANIDSTNMLAFIERIPYRETQSYVKLVMRNYFYYSRWYYPADQQLPMLDYLMPQVISIAKSEPLKDEPFVTQ